MLSGAPSIDIPDNTAMGHRLARERGGWERVAARGVARPLLALLLWLRQSTCSDRRRDAGGRRRHRNGRPRRRLAYAHTDGSPGATAPGQAIRSRAGYSHLRLGGELLLSCEGGRQARQKCIVALDQHMGPGPNDGGTCALLTRGRKVVDAPQLRAAMAHRGRLLGRQAHAGGGALCLEQHKFLVYNQPPME